MTIKKKPKDKVRFDRSVRYVNSHGQKFGKGVWIDEDGVMLLPGNGKMDRTTNSVLHLLNLKRLLNRLILRLKILEILLLKRNQCLIN